MSYAQLPVVHRSCVAFCFGFLWAFVFRRLGWACCSGRDRVETRTVVPDMSGRTPVVSALGERAARVVGPGAQRSLGEGWSALAADQREKERESGRIRGERPAPERRAGGIERRMVAAFERGGSLCLVVRGAQAGPYKWSLSVSLSLVKSCRHV